MGQPIVVVEKPSVANPGMVRFETNRALTGMGHERYLPSDEVRGDRPPDELARRLLARGGIEAIHINGSVVTVDLTKGHTAEGMREVIETLYLHYPPVDEDEVEAEVAATDEPEAAEPETETAEAEAAEPEAASDTEPAEPETASDETDADSDAAVAETGEAPEAVVDTEDARAVSEASEDDVADAATTDSDEPAAAEPTVDAEEPVEAPAETEEALPTEG